MAGSDGGGFIPYLPYGHSVPRALAASAFLLISCFLLMVSRLYVRKGNGLMSKTLLLIRLEALKGRKGCLGDAAENRRRPVFPQSAAGVWAVNAAFAGGVHRGL